MNKTLRFLLFGLFAFAGIALHAQSSTLPPATPTANTIPWTLPSNCTASQPCQFQVYRFQGPAPSPLAGSTGWTLLGTTAAQATNYVDNTPTGGVQYTYDVEAVPNGSTTVFSGPSNAGTVTTVFTPLPPTIGTVSST